MRRTPHHDQADWLEEEMVLVQGTIEALARTLRQFPSPKPGQRDQAAIPRFVMELKLRQLHELGTRRENLRRAGAI